MKRDLFGYHGRILRVSLSTGQLHVEEPSLTYLEHYLGGRGFIVTTLLKETPPHLDPLGPENRLIFATGPLTGVPLPGAGRHSIGAKSPLTEAYGESEAGGFFGAELKKAGFDALIIEGIAPEPVYLFIKNGQAELRGATHLWGMDVADTHTALKEETGERFLRTAIIGPAGEKMVRFAAVVHDLRHVAGRTGMGAVMGAKKLKAVVVKGNNLPPLHRPEILRELSHLMVKNYRKRATVWRYGTGANIEVFNLLGNLPVKNFKEGFFDAADKISAKTIMDNYGTGMHGCYACTLKCKKKVRLDGPYGVLPQYGGPEYETIAAFGSNCGISDPQAIIKAHEICNRYGLDTISAGVTLSFAMECFEKGILTVKDTGGLDLRFGNASAMLEVLQQIVTGEGLGKLLARGSAYAAQVLGGDAKELAMTVKGMELPMHDARLKQGMALHYSIHATGPDHCSGVQDTQFITGPPVEDWDSIDVCEPIPSTELSPRKVRMLYHNGLWKHLNNHLVFCYFVPFTHREICQAVEAATGWPMSFWRLMKTAERGITLMRLFNSREGFTRKDDNLPKRMAEPQETGNLKNVAVNPNKLSAMQRLYYQMLGWDEEGIPTEARMRELDIPWPLT